MLRRSILKISSRQSVRRIPRQISTQAPAFLSSRKEFSSTSGQKASQEAGSGENSTKTGGSLSRIVIGSVTLGAAAVAAYQAGYLDQIFRKEQHNSVESATIEVDSKHAKDVQHLNGVLANSEEPILNQKMEHDEQKVETHANFPYIEDSSVKNKDKSDLSAEVGTVQVQEEGVPDHSQTTMSSGDQSANSRISSEGSLDMKSTEVKTGMELKGEAPFTSVSFQASTIPKGNEIKSTPPEPLMTENFQQVQDELGKGLAAQYSLPDDYHPKDDADKFTAVTSTGKGTNGHKQFSKDREITVDTIEDINDAFIAKDGKLVLDFLEAIHAAEKRQSEIDAYVFAEEKRMLKEKYEKELKDARARELMYAEEAAILDQELNKERMKAANAIKSLQEKAEEKLKMELEQKENEAELKLKEVQELAKAELAAAIASEKASQIEKIAEADFHINALCMAFYAHSQEARQSHSVHKLALGALALEDTLSKGLPIQTEIEVLHTCLESIDKDSLLDLVLASLPEETRNNGTDTLSQLHQKFDDLKGTVRHFSLIPPGGAGGILTHSLAHIASWLKVKEVGESGDGIESVINRVESYLAEGRVAEAAEALEVGVRGSQAAEVVGDWVKRARNRAITEQALTFLQAYVTSISLT